MANSNGWGDGASNNSIGWGQGSNNVIGWGQSHNVSNAGLTNIVGGVLLDADAQAFITNANITNATQQAAINNLVTGLKTDGLWTKMKAIYPFVGGTASTHKFNLKDPRDLDAAFRLVFNGGWVHSGTGALPNGTNAYANTKLIPSVVQSLNSNGLGMYITQNSAIGDSVQIGAFNNTSQASSLVATSMSVVSRLNGNFTLATVVGGLGSFDTHKTSSTVTTTYKNGVSLVSYNSGGTLPTIEFYLATQNFNSIPYSAGYVNSEFRLAYFSDGLTSVEVGNLRTRVQAFQTTLSRQI